MDERGEIESNVEVSELDHPRGVKKCGKKSPLINRVLPFGFWYFWSPNFGLVGVMMIKIVQIYKHSETSMM